MSLLNIFSKLIEIIIYTIKDLKWDTRLKIMKGCLFQGMQIFVLLVRLNNLKYSCLLQLWTFQNIKSC